MILASSSPKSEMSSEPESFQSAMMACARIGGSLSRTRTINDERNSVYRSSPISPSCVMSSDMSAKANGFVLGCAAQEEELKDSREP